MKKTLCKPRHSLAKVLSVAALLLLPGYGRAQNLNQHYQNVSNEGIDYIPTNDYILSGNALPPTVNGWNNMGSVGGPNERIQLEKIDANLNSIWYKTYVTADEQLAVIMRTCTHLAVSFRCKYAKHTSDGGYIICGSVRRDGETAGCPGAMYDNIFLLKTDAVGNAVWFKRYDKAGMLNSVTETASGNFIACGYIGTGGVPNSSLIIGTDAGGNLMWSKSSLAGSPWDSTMIVQSYYEQVIPFGGRYALVGNVYGLMWSNMLVTIIDDAGIFYQNAAVDNYYWDYTLFGKSLVDAGDGDLAITGISGKPCSGLGGFTGSELMVTKLEPYSMNIKFLKFYTNGAINTEGYGITQVHGNKLCVTGTDISGMAVYTETDYWGNILRFVDLNTPDAESGMSITHNTLTDIATFSGQYSPYNTFVIKNDVGYDCNPDMGVTSYSPPYVVETVGNVDAGVNQINDIAYAYDMPRIESRDCGGTPPPPPPPPPPAAKNNNSLVASANGVGMTVTPNPADNEIQIGISVKNFSGGVAKIFDVAGRNVTTQHVDAGAVGCTIDISGLQHGVYMLRLDNNDGSSWHAAVRKN